jgi:hypothetical protein
MELDRSEYNWTDNPVVGMSLLIIGGSIDSFGDKINGNVYYHVGKHKVSGMTVILPTERNQKHEFVNSVWKKTGKLN